jgi:hypothetical protein
MAHATRDSVRILAIVGVVACAPPRPAPPQPQVDLIDAATYESKIAALRATLARSRVELDGGPVVRACGGVDSRGCVRCEVAARTDTAGFDPEMIDAVAIAFAHYPSKVLQAANLEHVALCKQIRYEAGDDTTPAGVAILGERRMLISIEPFSTERVHEGFTIEQVVHHELFHALDYGALSGTWERDTDWYALNPPGFAYRDPATASDRPRGFVDAYATTSEMEDRASTFEYLIGQPTKLCEIAKADPIVKRKVGLVWRRVAAVMGDELLRQSAPCVDWLAPARPARKPTKPPRRR